MLKQIWTKSNIARQMRSLNVLESCSDFGTDHATSLFTYAPEHKKNRYIKDTGGVAPG